ncbi:hypothetical protein [Streptomyces sp. S.PB5]|uniref:hypothetical protein n=1 Tax=Streptomyces sp. S.PB5 TaxID=3020844 RepID=UPI0025B05B95|nr:hypothetical protein [Streptomyces sp. S.PB5]MDN3020449.1 hypothetical protein [Streptomyces sp. S.PB5]
MPKFSRIAIPTLTAAVLTVATATSSHAATNTTLASSDSCGVVTFTDYGDIFRFLDTCSDGRGVRLQYTNPTTGAPSKEDAKINVDYTGGYTGWNTDNAWTYNTNMDEDACFYFRVGLVDNGSYVSGSFGTWSSRSVCAAN